MTRRANGSAIRDLREAIGLSQRELARRAGITPSQLCKVEAGINGLSVVTMRGVADGLGVSLDSISYPVIEVPA